MGSIFSSQPRTAATVVDVRSGRNQYLFIGPSGTVEVGDPSTNTQQLQLGTGSSLNAGLGTGSGGGSNRQLRTFHGGQHGVTIGTNNFYLRSDHELGWTSSTGYGTSSDLSLYRDASDTLAQRRSTSAQTFRIYNTYTDASNYERAKLSWSSNELLIGTEKAGTGVARPLKLQTDGTTRAGITAAGSVYVGSGAAALATTATDGFLYIPTCAGAPTGVPTAITGTAPLVADSTNNRVYCYLGGAWVALN